MPGRRTFVGLGEALLHEYPDRLEPGGLAASVAMAAKRLGHEGIAISRVGQDDAGEALLELLRETGVDTRHVQSDPDLATGRIVFRASGEENRRFVENHAAFDNLQADFDLEDVAQRADGVVYGVFTRRSGQTRAEEDRFLETCGSALRLFDLTHRDGGASDRGVMRSGLRLADIVILDEVAARIVAPGSASLADAAEQIRRQHDVSAVIIVHPAEGGGPDTWVSLMAADGPTAPVATTRPLVELAVHYLDWQVRGERPDAALNAAVSTDSE